MDSTVYKIDVSSHKAWIVGVGCLAQAIGSVGLGLQDVRRICPGLCEGCVGLGSMDRQREPYSGIGSV